MSREEAIKIIDKAILILLAVQVSLVSISIAASSIAFGVWGALFVIKLIFFRGNTGSFNPGKILTATNVFLILYCIFEIVSRFFAVYPEGAFHNLKRLLLFLIFYASVFTIPDFRWLGAMILVNVTVISVISTAELVQYAIKFGTLIRSMPFSEIRIDYFNYPITTAEIKMMTLLSVFPLLFISKDFFIKKKFLFLLMIPTFISMMLTQSRNVFVATFACVIIFGIIRNRKFLIALIALVIVLALVVPAEYTERIRSIFDISHPSNASRVAMWKTGFRMFMDHPLTGVADSHIREIYETYRKPEAPGEGVHLHSNFMMILATTGIFGFISYIGYFVSLFIAQLKVYYATLEPVRKALIAGSILVMISLHISGIFEWNFGDHEVMTVFFFLTAVPFVIFRLGNSEDTVT